MLFTFIIQVNKNKQINIFFNLNSFLFNADPATLSGVTYKADYNLGSAWEHVCHYKVSDFSFRVLNTRLLLRNTEDAYIVRFNFEFTVEMDRYLGIHKNYWYKTSTNL